MSKKEKNDGVLKVISILAALVLWFYASADINPLMEKSFDVNIEYLNKAEDMLVVNEQKRVSITVKGRQNDLLTLRNDDFGASVDLTGAVKGTTNYPLIIRVPENVERYTVSATSVELRLEQWETKTVPLKLETSGEVAASYQLKNTTLSQETLTIRGYSHILADIWQISTQALELSNITASGSQELGLVLPEGVKASQDKVQVNLEITEVERKREFELPVNTRNLNEKFSAVLDKERVVCRLQGTDKEFAGFNVEQILLYVDCADLTLGKHTLEIQMENNSVFTTVELTPASVEVEIDNQPNNMGAVNNG